ncbi:hypothetical protein KCU73_g6647, partial [Aureobasidium melanogenum]
MNNPVGSTDGNPCKTSRPASRDMIVSIARHKTSFEDSTFTCQLPLGVLHKGVWEGTDYLEVPALFQFYSIIEHRLSTSRTDMSVVWCLTESGQLAVINDIDSLRAAVKDHQNAGKGTIQLYLVNNSDMMNLPKHTSK